MKARKFLVKTFLLAFLLFSSYFLYSNFVSASQDKHMVHLSELEKEIVNHHWYGKIFNEPIELIFNVDKQYTLKTGSKTLRGTWELESDELILNKKHPVRFKIQADSLVWSDLEFSKYPQNAEPFKAKDVNAKATKEMFNGTWFLNVLKSGEAIGQASLFFIDECVLKIADGETSFFAEISKPKKSFKKEHLKTRFENNCIKFEISENIEATGYLLEDGMLELRLKYNGYSAVLWFEKESHSPRLKAGACKEERKLLLAGKHF